MKCKLIIVEPWESGTEKAIEADIIKETERELLIFSQTPIIFRGNKAHWFICELRNKHDQIEFKNRLKKNYPINMVYDYNINSSDIEIPEIDTYRGNFLSGEIIL